MKRWPWNDARDIELTRRMANRETFEAIGLAMGCSRSRAHSRAQDLNLSSQNTGALGSGRVWTAAEKATLSALVDAKTPARLIAVQLHCSKSEVERLIPKLGLKAQGVDKDNTREERRFLASLERDWGVHRAA